MKNRTKSREYAVQMMYQHEYSEEGDDVALLFWETVSEENGNIINFAKDLFETAKSRQSENDALIRSFLKQSWSLERVGLMEKSVLRVALGEMFLGDAPIHVILNDYVGISGKYCDTKSIAFINGILDKIKEEFNVERC